MKNTLSVIAEKNFSFRTVQDFLKKCDDSVPSLQKLLWLPTVLIPLLILFGLSMSYGQ